MPTPDAPEFHLPSEALHRTSPADVLPRIERERVPTCSVARELVPDMRRMCSAGRAGVHPECIPIGAGGAARSYHFYGAYQRFNSNQVESRTEGPPCELFSF